MPSKDLLRLSDDSPKEDPWQEDLLGFRPFAERLSQVILSLRMANGYVIGLHGEWGSGKSTAINFVKAFLQKHNAETEDQSARIEIIDFRPWIVSGHQDLITAFFKVLSEKLPRPGVVRRWGKRALRGLRRTADPILDAIATIGVVADPSGGIAAKAAGKVAATSLNSAIDKFLREPSLQSAYDTLRGLLQHDQKRFLVIIDDLDRLQKEEIRAIMQMVKTVGRLPNVLYLLAYDRDIVWEALDEGVAATRSGPNPNFGEKIVQQEIKLPRPLQEDLLAILDSELAFITNPTPNDARWQFMVRDGVRRWIQHPRDVQRLANAVKFSWPALQHEIDSQDLLIMEGMRLFDERVFNWLSWNRDWLFSTGRYLLAEEAVRKAGLKSLNEIVPEQEREAVMQLLSHLFPFRSKLFGNVFYSENYSDIARRRGIGCEAGYDAYFMLYPSPNEVPKSVVDLALSKLDDKSFLTELIESYIEVKDRTKLTMVGRLLQEFSYRFMGQDRVSPTQPLLDALFDVSEKIIATDWVPGSFRVSPTSAWAGLISQMLLTWGEADAGNHLENSFKSAKSISLCASVFVQRARELRKIEGSTGDPPLITPESLERLGKILLPRIEKAAADGTLQYTPRLWDITCAWKYFGRVAQVKDWITANISSSTQFLCDITNGFVLYTVGSEPREYSMHGLPDPDLYDLQVLLDACQRFLKSNEGTADARNRIRVVAQAILQHLSERSGRGHD